MPEIYYIIVPPVSPWDKKIETRIQLDIGLSTMSRTAGRAWFKQTRGDMSNVQAWFDRGYRVRRVKVELLPESETPEEVKNNFVFEQKDI